MLGVKYKPFMLNIIMLSAIMLSIIMLSVTYAECHLCWVPFMLSVTYAVSFMLSVTYDECHYGECHLCWVPLRRVTLVLIAIMLSVIILNVVASSYLFCSSVSDEEKEFDKTKTWAQCYNTFYVRNLQNFVIS